MLTPSRLTLPSPTRDRPRPSLCSPAKEPYCTSSDRSSCICSTPRLGMLHAVRTICRAPPPGHEALVGGGIRQHGGLLGLAGGRDSLVAVGVIAPGGIGAFPASGDPADRPFDVHDLEHQLQPGAAELAVSSSSPVDIGPPASSAPRTVATWSRGGKAVEANHSQMERSAAPHNSTTSARSRARPARPI